MFRRRSSATRSASIKRYWDTLSPEQRTALNRRIHLTPEMEVILRRYIIEYKLPLEVAARAFGVTSLVIRRFCKELHISFTHYKGKPPPQSEYLQHLSKLPFKGRKK